MSDYTYERVVGAYVEARDAVEVIAARHKEELAPLRERMAKMEAWFLARLTLDKNKTVRTEFGTVYTKETAGIKIVDLGALEAFANNNGENQLFKIEPDKGAIKDYIDEHAGNLPPGVDISYFTQAVVRRA